jgi:hypothetical protein
LDRAGHEVHYLCEHFAEQLFSFVQDEQLVPPVQEMEADVYTLLGRMRVVIDELRRMRVEYAQLLERHKIMDWQRKDQQR